MATKDLGRVRGYSAYEIAQKNGFSGSEQAWLASLKGEKGEAGDVDLSTYATKKNLLKHNWAVLAQLIYQFTQLNLN